MQVHIISIKTNIHLSVNIVWLTGQFNTNFNSNKYYFSYIVTSTHFIEIFNGITQVKDIKFGWIMDIFMSLSPLFKYKCHNVIYIHVTLGKSFNIS